MEELIRLKQKNEQLKRDIAEYQRMYNYLLSTAETAVRINEQIMDIHLPHTKYRCKMKVVR